MKLFIYNKQFRLTIQYKTSNRTMRFPCSIFLVLFFFTAKCHSLNVLRNISSTLLEDSVKLKLKAGLSLRENVLRILNQIKSNNYELQDAVDQIKEYLKNGGSLIDCLNVLPALGYISVQKQINGILTAMEEHFPRYLLPAVSVVRNACGCRSNILDIEDMLQPDGGPLLVDIFEGISAHDLPKLAAPTPFPKDVERQILHEQSPSFIEKVIVSISMGFLNGTTPLVELILQNLMHSIEEFSYNFSSKDQEITDSKLDSDLHKLVKNVVSGTDQHNSITATTGRSILRYLNENLKISRELPKLATFYVGERVNCSLLLSDNKRLMKTSSAKTLLSLIQNNDTLLQNALHDLCLHEYSTPDDLLMAMVSKLRRYQAQEGTISESVENLYKDLVRKSPQKRLPQSGGAVKTLLYSMQTDQNSPKIRRLAKDVSASIEIDVEPEAWTKILSYVPDLDFYGPSSTVLRTLELVQNFHATKGAALNASISELVKTYKQYYHEDVFESCPNLLVNSNWFGNFKSKRMFERRIDVDDLMQAIPGSDVESREYIILRDFLSTKDLEKYIEGNIDLEAHPTRGRLLVWLLGQIEKSIVVNEEIRNAARRFVDEVSYDGYGAAAVLVRST